MLEKMLHILISYLDIIPIVLSGTLLIAFTVFLSKLVGEIVRYFLPKTLDHVLLIFIPRAVKFFTFIFGTMIALSLAGVNTTSLTTMFGISSLAIGMALKDLFVNTIQGLMIVINQPFTAGDEITVNGATGTVMRIGLMYTRLDCGTEEKLVPNNKIFTEIVSVKKS